VPFHRSPDNRANIVASHRCTKYNLAICHTDSFTHDFTDIVSAN